MHTGPKTPAPSLFESHTPDFFARYSSAIRTRVACFRCRDLGMPALPQGVAAFRQALAGLQQTLGAGVGWTWDSMFELPCRSRFADLLNRPKTFRLIFLTEVRCQNQM